MILIEKSAEDMLLPWDEGGMRGQHVKRKTKRLNSGNILVQIFIPL